MKRPMNAGEEAEEVLADNGVEGKRNGRIGRMAPRKGRRTSIQEECVEGGTQHMEWKHERENGSTR